MNSLSKTHCKDDREPISKHFDDCEPSRRCHKKEENQEFVLLKVGNPQTTVISSTAVFTIASLPVKIGCLDDPEIKVDFAANITPGTPAAGIDFTLQVNKLFITPFNPLTAIPVGPAWRYTTDTPPTNDIISFFVKDTDTFDDGVVRYFVTAVTTSNLITAGNSSVTFSNATLAVTIAAEE